MGQLLLVAMILLGAVAAPAVDGIAAVEEGGRTVYVDAPTHRKPLVASQPKVATGLVYWSRAKNRWIAIKAPSASSMQAAKTAAEEVDRQVKASPERTDLPAAEAYMPPDDREILRGRAMSSTELDKVIEEAAQRHNVDAHLVRAVVQVESNFNPHAISPKGAMGLMQLMPATARNLRVSNPFDPQQNVDAGVRHLRGLLDNFHGDVKRSLAAYNAGSGAVLRSNGVPAYRETRQYVRRITQLYGGGNGSARTPIHMYRDSSGVLTISNE